MILGRYKFCCVGLVLALAGAILTGCKSNSSTPAAAGQSAGDTYTSKALTTSYTGALSASNQLMLGMLRLEGTEQAITSEQAKALRPIAQALQGQALKSDAERNAVFAHIEAQLTPAQVAAIVAMHLTQDDLQTWTRDAGPGQVGAGPQGAPGAGPVPGGAGPQGTPGAGPGQGGVRPQGTPGARPGQGGARPQGTPNAASGQNNVLMSSLIRLLASKSAPAAAPAPALTPTKP